jgi:hypothetical protein
MRGQQEPRIKVEPHRVMTDGADAALLMSTYGVKLDPWQQIVIDSWLGKDESGQYNVTSAGLSLPRQNGKNVCLEAREFYGMVINGEKILHTAHQVRTSKKSFRRLAAMFTDKKHPEITDIVKNIRYTNGEEAIELDNGGQIEFSARSRQAARGFDGISLVVYDEAQELMDEQVEAIMATLSASTTGTRQIIYTGTPPYPNCPGEVFRRRRTNSMESPGGHDAWHEWSIDSEPISKIDVTDKKLWYMSNPALGIRLDEEFTEEEQTTMSPDGFARERLGWWAPMSEHKLDYAIPLDLWNSAASEAVKPEGKTAFGVKFSADGTEVVICGAVIPKEGPARIEMIDRKPTGYGTQWLADFINARYSSASCVVIDGKNGVDVLVDKITPVWRMKGTVVRPRATDMIAAVSLLMDSLTEGTVTWYSKQEALKESAVTSVKRPISGGWGFGGENSTPIEACALALWGAKNSKRDPTRKMRIG